MTGRRVLGTVALILFATGVLPPAGAYVVQRSRLRSAATQVEGIARGLRQDEQALPELTRGIDVLCGLGLMPKAQRDDAQRWVTAPRAAWPGSSLVPAPPPDPWGNCYIVNVGAAGVWVLSAGANGIIETPFSTPSPSTSGDDVGVRLR
jgi:hypothetical protein